MAHASTVSQYGTPVLNGTDLPSGTVVSMALESVMEMSATLQNVCDDQQRAIAAARERLQANRARLEHLRELAAALQVHAARKPRRRRVAA